VKKGRHRDPDCRRVENWIRSLNQIEARCAGVFRSSFDSVYDGVNTGRYCWNQLYGTERKGFEDIIRINLQREFKFTDGQLLDYSIAGVEVDCKYSQQSGSWMIPPEAHNHLCLVVSADDQASV
jgi:hypothetical protein